MFDKTRLPYVALDVLCVLLAGLPFAILTSRHTPFQRGIFCTDESIKYPYKEDTIPYALLGGIIIPFSIIVMIIGEALSVYYNLLHSNSFIRNNYIATIYKAIGTFLFGAAASQSLTDIAKYSIGRLRPHFLDVCDPDWSKINCSAGYIENYICRGNAQKVKEGRLSFYSGHSSFSMYCMLFVAVSTLFMVDYVPRNNSCSAWVSCPARPPPASCQLRSIAGRAVKFREWMPVLLPKPITAVQKYFCPSFKVSKRAQLWSRLQIGKLQVNRESSLLK
uniref:Phospholipid phosphatase 1 n=1 Tax=Suricata suricatta TaxID=37032 RepID=A0A673U0Y1_SURSU